MKYYVAEISGLLGGGISAIMFIPQILKMHRTKLANDISSSTLVMGIVASAFVFIHAFLVNSTFLMLGCGISVGIRIFTLLYKLKLDAYSII